MNRWLKIVSLSFKSEIWLLALAFALVGCSNKTIYGDEDFSKQPFYTRKFDALPEVVMRACRNTAMQRHYAIEIEDANRLSIKVQKINQLEDDRYAGLVIEAAASYASQTSSILRTLAYEKQYEVTKNHEFAHVQVVLITIPLPTGEKQSVTEVSNETVENPEFYEKLYAAVADELEQARTELNWERKKKEQAEIDHITMEESVRQNVRSGVGVISDPSSEIPDTTQSEEIQKGTSIQGTPRESTDSRPSTKISAPPSRDF